MAIADDKSLLQLFADVMSEEQWRELEGKGKGAQIYTLRVVVGLMLLQRMNDRGSQQVVVEQMAAGKWDGWLPDCKRVREVAQRTNDQAGDGTTTATVLA